MKSRILILIFLFTCLSTFAQDLSTFRSRRIDIQGDTILVDTTPVLPGSLFLLDDMQRPFPDSLFHLIDGNSLVIVDPRLAGRNVTIQYRVLSADLPRPYFHKDPSRIQDRQQIARDPFRLSSSDMKASQYYTYSELNKRGSLSRGITFGNNQDVVINSNLNLQLTGKLSENLNIVAAISDNNIPIQPEGYSQQISEFDRVYIELFNEQLRLIAGDFELQGSPGSFMNFYKRAKGAMFNGNFKPGKTEDNNFTTTVSGAISKGRFSRNSFTGIEGNQGPYKLEGSNNEQFIVVLAGSERVYIDGRLLSRGVNNDYVIDYNNAEITFTPNQPMTKDKRLIVEFEYSERSYARFLVYTSNEIRTSRGKLWLNAFSEQDDKNQTLQQDLSDDEKYYLSQIGNNIHDAVVPRIDSVGYNPDEVLYRKIDSLVGGTMYGNVYVYSTHPDSAHYRLRFSYVGAGNGDYEPVNSVTNGKVFRWYAPVNGIRQGSYEPVVLLITPRKKQVFSFGGVQMLSDLTRTTFELALTNNDPNTFSKLDAHENIGYAFDVGLDQDMLQRDTSRIRLQGSLKYRHTSRYFQPVERFRSIEYSRDWNIELGDTSNQEHLASVALQFYERQAGNLRVLTEFLSRGNSFRGIRNHINGNLRYRGFEMDMNGSLMNSQDPFNETRFLRHRLTLARHFPFMVLGIREEGENNRWQDRRNDSLMLNSFAFQEFEVFLTQPDSFQNQGFITYKNRRDFLPDGNALHYATLGQDLNLGMNLMKSPNHHLRTQITYRELSVRDTLLGSHRPEKTVIGRLEHGLQLARGAIITSTFYEVGSGLETKKEYSYLEVAPGQGVYQWIDYNQNGIKELDEFEIAQFQDEARYIRIFFPSSDFLNVYTNQFNQTLSLNPARVWKTKGGFQQFASLFADQFAYRINRKNSTRNIMKNLNPFLADLNDPDLLTLSTSIRNNLSFNKTGQVFGADYIYQRNLSRILLANGFDTRTSNSHGLRIRLSLGNGMSLTDQLDRGDKAFQSEFLSNRNYQIDFITNKLSLQYQISMAFRLVADYGFKNQVNRTDSQQSGEHNLGTELRYSILNKGILTTRLNYVHLAYNDDPGSPVAYEMLGGLLPGHNGTWTVLFHRSITGGIEVNVEYSGRVSENQAVIHTGSLQVRANF